VRQITFVDTTLRDGQMSLWATGMRTSWLLPVVGRIARAGFTAMELLASAFEFKMIHELHEDPWERMRLAAAEAGDVPLRMIMSRSMRAFQLSPRSVNELLCERVAANGLRQARVSDPSNTIANLGERVRLLRSLGIEPILNLIYSLSPRHTDAYYAERARQAAALRPFALCIKDPGGLLTPERTRTLVPAVLAEAGDVPVEFHTHCTTGLGPLCCLAAVEQGITRVNAAIPPLSDGTSNPSVLQLAHNLRARGYEVALDTEALLPVREHLTRVARREGLPLGRPVSYEAAYLRHQVPGGMSSNLRHQLARRGLAHRHPDVLEEIARVREEFGYPIMVTPYSQFVGTQATLNVVTGERYGQVTDEIILYANGAWGAEESDSIDPNVRDRILARPRARQLSGWRPPEPSREDLRREMGGPGVSDDELALRTLVGLYDRSRVRPVGPRPAGGWTDDPPLVALVRGIAARPQVGYLRLDWAGSSLTLAGGSGGV
jgi:oxaloacetate decarboxylase alpha subunit